LELKFGHFVKYSRNIWKIFNFGVEGRRISVGPIILRCVIPVVCRKTNGEVNVSHENTTMVVWIYDGV